MSQPLFRPGRFGKVDGSDERANSMQLHCNEGSSEMASASFTDLRIPSSVYTIQKGLVVGANMIFAPYSGFKAIDSLIFDNVVIAERLKW